MALMHIKHLWLVNVNSQNGIKELKSFLKLWKILLRKIMSVSKRLVIDAKRYNNSISMA